MIVVVKTSIKTSLVRAVRFDLQIGDPQIITLYYGPNVVLPTVPAQTLTFWGINFYCPVRVLLSQVPTVFLVLYTIL